MKQMKHAETCSYSETRCEADEETIQLMLKFGGNTRRIHSHGFLDADDCRNFPKEELCIMDDLWVKYSNGRFGFSVQKKIWIDCEGRPGVYDDHVFAKFSARLGWKTHHGYLIYSDFIFNTNQPQGHLPTGWRLMLNENLQSWTLLTSEFDSFISFFSTVDYNR